MKLTHRVPGRLLLRSLIRSHRSLICSLRTARLARPLHCAHSFTRSLTLTQAHGINVHFDELSASFSYRLNTLCAVRRFHGVSTHCALSQFQPTLHIFNLLCTFSTYYAQFQPTVFAPASHSSTSWDPRASLRGCTLLCSSRCRSGSTAADS